MTLKPILQGQRANGAVTSSPSDTWNAFTRSIIHPEAVAWQAIQSNIMAVTAPTGELNIASELLEARFGFSLVTRRRSGDDSRVLTCFSGAFKKKKKSKARACAQTGRDKAWREQRRADRWTPAHLGPASIQSSSPAHRYQHSRL